MSPTDIRPLLKAALAEDWGDGDVTSLSLIEPDDRARMSIVAREPGVVAGLEAAAMVFDLAEPSLKVDRLVADGATVEPGDAVLRVEGPARGILLGERLALNLLQRLSGIATATRVFVDRVRPHPVALLDTRKTTPLWRALEKHAVRCGGGTNHRAGLYDRILIKDNHLAIWRRKGRGALADAVRQARARYPGLIVEIEVENIEELRDALEGGPDWVLLDNMTPEELRACVELCAGRCKLEASGGIHLETVAAMAAAGVDALSVGALTHSARALDFGLDFEAAGGA